jgi:hypothetical protein
MSKMNKLIFAFIICVSVELIKGELVI